MPSAVLSTNSRPSSSRTCTVARPGPAWRSRVGRSANSPASCTSSLLTELAMSRSNQARDHAPESRTVTHPAAHQARPRPGVTYGHPIRPVGAADSGMRQGDGVHFIGIDLAWGDRAAHRPRRPRRRRPAAARERGAHRRRDRGRRWRRTSTGDCLAAIDAPIVVTNATGSRPAEQAAQQDFRRYDAGTHPSNTGKPEFANGTRGARVGQAARPRHRPAVRSAATGDRGLPAPGDGRAVRAGRRSLKYKAKPGRDLDLLRAELLRLMTFVAGVGLDRRDLAGLRDQVENATRKSELRRGRGPGRRRGLRLRRPFADRRPDRVTTLRRPRDRLHRHPDSLRSCGRRRRPADPVREAVREYAAQHAEPGRRRAAGASRCVAAIARRGRHQLPDRDRPGQVGRVVRREGGAHRRRGRRSTPTRCEPDHRPARASG